MSLVKIFLCSLIFIVSSCATTEKKSGEPPKITAKLSVDDLVTATMDYGGKVYADVIKEVSRRKAWQEVERLTAKKIRVGLENLNSNEIVSVVKLYAASAKKLDKRVFASLIFSEIPLARQMGWNLASQLSSQETAKTVDDALSLILAEGNENSHFIPEMAKAVSANRLASSYRVLKQGLMTTGDDAFASAMIALNPSEASKDFLDYLSLAPIEDLRQLNQQEVNMMTCLVILRHLTVVPPPVNHAKYENIFLYAVSRNNGLAEMARSVLEVGFQRDKSRHAFILARLPAWIQVAYVEGVKPNMNSNIRGFLSELRKITVQDDVLEELKNISL